MMIRCRMKKKDWTLVLLYKLCDRRLQKYKQTITQHLGVGGRCTATSQQYTARVIVAGLAEAREA